MFSLGAYRLARSPLSTGGRVAGRRSPAARLRAGFRRVAKNNSGAVMMEFALITPAFVALLVAALQTGLVFFAQQALETTAEKAGRQILTGTVQKGNKTQSEFKTIVCSKLPGFMECGKVMVDLKKYASFNDVTTARPTLTTDGSGNITNAWAYESVAPGDIAVMRVMYLWPTGTGPLGFDLSTVSGGRRLMVATAVFRAEPYK